jgi:hypothetical protein
MPSLLSQSTLSPAFAGRFGYVLGVVTNSQKLNTFGENH